MSQVKEKTRFHAAGPVPSAHASGLKPSLLSSKLFSAISNGSRLKTMEISIKGSKSSDLRSRLRSSQSNGATLNVGALNSILCALYFRNLRLLSFLLLRLHLRTTPTRQAVRASKRLVVKGSEPAQPRTQGTCYNIVGSHAEGRLQVQKKKKQDFATEVLGGSPGSA